MKALALYTHTHTGDLINKKRFILNNNIDLNFGENSKLSINNKLYNKKYLNKSTGITIISLIVTPNTGKNLNVILPIGIGIMALVVLGAGVVIIKKKAL